MSKKYAASFNGGWKLEIATNASHKKGIHAMPKERLTFAERKLEQMWTVLYKLK